MLCNVNYPIGISWVPHEFTKSIRSIKLCDHFYFHSQSHHGNHSMDLFLLGFDVCDTFVGVFISCELSQRVSNSFSGINDLLDQLQWYRFPTEVQRILPMASIFVQESVAFECFGSFSCCRDAFKKVIGWNRIQLLTFSTHFLTGVTLFCIAPGFKYCILWCFVNPSIEVLASKF